MDSELKRRYFKKDFKKRYNKLQSSYPVQAYYNQIDFIRSKEKRNLHYNEEDLICLICNRSFKKIFFFRRHCYYNHGFCEEVQQFKCKICGAIFSEKDSFEKHVNLYKENAKYCLLKHKEINYKKIQKGYLMSNYGLSVSANKALRYPLKLDENDSSSVELSSDEEKEENKSGNVIVENVVAENIQLDDMNACDI